MRRAAVSTFALLALAAVPASDAGGGALNLVATPKVKAMLRASFLIAHHQYKQRRVKGPLRGKTYYGSYRNTEYAVATFSVPRTGTTDQPEIFKRPAGGLFRDSGDTGGEICKRKVPLPLIKVWRLKPSGSGCYVTP
jgi:hypothetical protein